MEEQLLVKQQALLSGLIIELEPNEADFLEVSLMEEISPQEPDFEHLLNSRFDPSEFNQG